MKRPLNLVNNKNNAMRETFTCLKDYLYNTPAALSSSISSTFLCPAALEISKTINPQACILFRPL